MHILSSPGQGMPGFSGIHGNTVERKIETVKKALTNSSSDLSVTSPHLTVDLGVKKQSLSRPLWRVGIDGQLVGAFF